MKLNLALLVGGYSKEHEISLRSGQQIANSLDSKKYNIYLIVIDKENWYCLWNNKKINVDRSNFTITVDGEVVKFVLVMPMIHGTPGEDGKIQAYLDMLKIPYTGCDMFASAVTFNKYYCKAIVENAGIPVAKSIFLKNNNINPEYVVENIGLPCFVKPNKNGSSVGVTKVKTKEDLLNAVDNAFKEDNEVLIEEFVPGREFSCGIYNDNGQIIVLPITEIVSKNEFFDYEAKYTPTKSDEITPADINQDLQITIYAYTNLIYQTLNCKGVVRVDFIANDKKICFLEVNATPGMSAESIIPKQLEHYGKTMTELLEVVIAEALNNKSI
ncbi:MAG: D-alanine--D-alanine ligase [Bacteroidales bacterium]|jgi:D-alanine-D-alanine ligase